MPPRTFLEGVGQDEMSDTLLWLGTAGRPGGSIRCPEWNTIPAGEMTMKLFTLAFLALFTPVLPLTRATEDSPVVRFEKDGVRIGAAWIQGPVLGLMSTGTASLLASGTSIEALTTTLDVKLAPERRLTLEPGLRVTRVETGYRFSTHQGRKIHFKTGAACLVSESPAAVAVTVEGWTIADQKIAGAELRAGIQNQQDDSDTNLQRMKEASQRMNTDPGPAPSTRMTLIFQGGNPLIQSEAASSVILRIITQISPTGGP